MAQLTITYEGGKFINDPLVEIFLNDELIGKGNMQTGFSIRHETNPGVVQLRLKYFIRDQKFSVEIPESGRSFRLKYSRAWGNFKLKH